MSRTTGSDLGQASREATDWLILLRDDPDDADLATRFEDWLRQRPANAVAWESTLRTSEAIGRASPRLADRWQAALDRERRGPQAGGTTRRPRPTGRRRALQLGAAMALAASIVVAVAGPGLMRDLRSDHATGTGETRTVRLDDDSLVTLAPESAIRVDYEAGARRVSLLDGQAFFEVAPDPARPFLVTAGPDEVAVLGTGFDVRRDDGATEVGVEHGVVRVGRAAAVPPVAERLTAGRALRIGPSGRAERDDRPATQIGAWRRNQLIAQDQPLGEVVDRLRRYHRGRIFVTDPVLAARPVTGVYDLADPEGALRAIARAHKGVVRAVTPWLLFVSAS